RSLAYVKNHKRFPYPLWPHFKGAAMTTSSTLPSKASKTWESPAHKRTVYGVLAIVATAILFDGYDLVIYGAVLPNLLADPTQIGQLSPAVAGTLGSWAMIGVTIGALSAGAIGDPLVAAEYSLPPSRGSHLAWR